ncbi:hypothetical protein MNB_SM-6-525 [hydrothermal vent metagenome]|uniref:Uncharacterized protein n=1 Tax=hydrothermal vent metagenome TaxID=652676 RepID=A0A1W1CFI8_9ZZZZ
MKQQIWLKELKGAVVQKNVTQIETLLENIPSFNTLKEMQTTLYLLEEAKRVVESLKKETAISMAQMKKNIDFLNSATAEKRASFDITS